MTRSEELVTFVKEALSRGSSRAEIEDVLLRAGWSPRQVGDALDGFAEMTFPIPVPKPRNYTDARDTFLYGLLFMALSLTAYNLGGLIFAFIEQAYPRPEYVTNLGDATRWPLSILVVALPIFLFVSRLVNRDARQDPSGRASKRRIQMAYLTLFVCASVVISVLAAVVYNFLGDEITLRFILKSITVAVIAAGVFAYYRREVKAGNAESAPRLAGVA